MRRIVIRAFAGLVLTAGLLAVPAAGEAVAEPRRSLGHNTVGTSFPYHPGYFRFWFGDRDIGLLDRSYPLPPSSYAVNPDRAAPYPHERRFSRSRHVTGPDLHGFSGGSPHVYDIDSWYGWPSAEQPIAAD